MVSPENANEENAKDLNQVAQEGIAHTKNKDNNVKELPEARTLHPLVQAEVAKNTLPLLPLVLLDKETWQKHLLH